MLKAWYAICHSTGTNNKTTKHYATLLEVAVQRRSMLSDIVHFFSLRSTSIQVVEEDLAYLIRAFEINNNGFPNVWMQEVLGSAVETYRHVYSHSLSHYLNVPLVPGPSPRSQRLNEMI